MTVALVTGSHGFVGAHLRALLLDAGWDVVGLGRTRIDDPPAGERYVQADVTDQAAMDAVIHDVRPDIVFHLAGVVGQKARDPVALVHSAVDGTRALCRAMRNARTGTRRRLVLAGSSAQYGRSPTPDQPLTEDSPCRPVSAYGHAKLAAESVAFALSADAAFDVVAARAFNHIGPGESPATVAGAIASRVAAVLRGEDAQVEVADAAVVRDFTDVRDIATGYLALAEHGRPGRVYNLCSGRGTSVGQIADLLLAAARLDRSIVVERVSDRPPAIPCQIGAPARVHADTGWKATVPLETSVSDLLATVGAA